jgi:hypothetical protein
MVCWQLRQLPEPVLRVSIPAGDDPPYVALHMPADLAELYSTRRELTGSERAILGEEFERIRSGTGLLRRLDNGRIIGVPADHYDRFLLESCASRWTPAPRVVGTAMARCDRCNLMSDLFFSSRLQILIGARRIEADAVPRRLRDYAVRPARSR